MSERQEMFSRDDMRRVGMIVFSFGFLLGAVLVMFLLMLFGRVS